jgi:hypothetical protein
MFSSYFQPVSSLTDSLRPVYSRHEVELCICEGATLYSGDEKVGKSGCIFLSTHRLIWQEGSTAAFLHLALLSKVEHQVRQQSSSQRSSQSRQQRTHGAWAATVSYFSA